MFPEKTRFGRDTKTQVSCYQVLTFMGVSKIRDLFAFQSALRGCEAELIINDFDQRCKHTVNNPS